MTIKSILSLSGIASIMMLASGPASAHLLVAYPDKFDAKEGEKIEVAIGLAEPLIAMNLSKEKILAKGFAGNPGVVHLQGSVLFHDGTETALADFKPINPELPHLHDPAEATADKTEFSIQKPGTIVVKARMDFNSSKRPTVTFAKTLINWKNDGQTGKKLGGEEVLEIVLLNDPGPVKVGDSLTAQVFLRGKPLAGADISATFDGAPKHKDSEENDYLTAKTDADGKVTFKFDTAKPWVIGLEYIDETHDSKNPAYPEKAGIRYRSSVTFPVK